MITEILAGPQARTDGAILTARATRSGAMAVAAAHGELTEAAQRGTVMIACTAAAGVAPGTALSTTPPLAIWNPPSSGRDIAILRASLGYVSGTLGAGSIVYGVVDSQPAAPTTGTELTPRCSRIGAVRGVARAFSGSTLAVAPSLLRPVFRLGASLATTALAPDAPQEFTNGGIIIPPGAVLCLQGIAAAGTSPLVLLSLSYEELPI